MGLAAHERLGALQGIDGEEALRSRRQWLEWARWRVNAFYSKAA